jgi:hypothetical protein
MPRAWDAKDGSDQVIASTRRPMTDHIAASPRFAYLYGARSPDRVCTSAGTMKFLVFCAAMLVLALGPVQISGQPSDDVATAVGQSVKSAGPAFAFCEQTTCAAKASHGGSSGNERPSGAFHHSGHHGHSNNCGAACNGAMAGQTPAPFVNVRAERMRVRNDRSRPFDVNARRLKPPISV